MKMGIKHSGTGAVITMLRNLATRVPDGARAQTKRSAARVVKLAKLMTPEDTGDLANSIRIEKTYGERGRLVISIIAGNETVVKAGGREIDLNQYAALVHEAYETSVAYVNGPGKNTLRKMAENPGILIGSGFLTRAMATEEEKIMRFMTVAITQIIKEAGG